MTKNPTSNSNKNDYGHIIEGGGGEWGRDTGRAIHSRQFNPRGEGEVHGRQTWQITPPTPRGWCHVGMLVPQLRRSADRRHTATGSAGLYTLVKTPIKHKQGPGDVVIFGKIRSFCSLAQGTGGHAAYWVTRNLARVTHLNTS